jgi:hypothetical protein
VDFTSINSVDAFLEADDIMEFTTEESLPGLERAVDHLLERKAGVHEIEAALEFYVKSLICHFTPDIVYRYIDELIPLFVRRIKTERTEKETLLALRALALSTITYPDMTIYEKVSEPLKRCVLASSVGAIKAGAISCLGVCTMWGGAGEDEIVDVLNYLLEIVSSDGAFVNADDNAEVVTAALQTYGFLATLVEDMEAESEDAVAAFLDQLDADDVRVQVAAGENIALLYEKSCTEREGDDDYDSESEDAAVTEEEAAKKLRRDESGRIKRYNAYHNTDEVLEKVKRLASAHTKAMNRRDKLFLHKSFPRIATTIEEPKLGIQARRDGAGDIKVRIHGDFEIRVDQWQKLMRLNAIRRVLGVGFVNHYFEGNKQLSNTVPAAPSIKSHGAGKFAKGQFKDRRRFIGADEDD